MTSWDGIKSFNQVKKTLKRLRVYKSFYDDSKIFKVVTESANPVETTHCCFPLITPEWKILCEMYTLCSDLYDIFIFRDEDYELLTGEKIHEVSFKFREVATHHDYGCPTSEIYTRIWRTLKLVLFLKSYSNKYKILTDQTTIFIIFPAFFFQILS